MSNKVCSTGDRLKTIMDERRMRQVDILNAVQPLCRTYGVSFNKSALSQYISGVNEPGQKKLYILAEALNVSEVWLMGYDVPRERPERGTETEQPTSKREIAMQWLQNEATPDDLVEFIGIATRKLRK